MITKILSGMMIKRCKISGSTALNLKKPQPFSAIDLQLLFTIQGIRMVKIDLLLLAFQISAE